MANTKVKVEFFKPRSKKDFGFNLVENFETEYQPWDIEEINHEVFSRFPASVGNAIAVEVEKGIGWNKWLITP